MSRRTVFARTLVAASLLVAAHVTHAVSGAQTTSTPQAQTTDQARAAFLRALATKDTAQLRVAFTDDAITLFAQSSATKPNSGLPQIQQFYADLFGRANSFEMKFVPDEVVRGKFAAVETGTWSMPAFHTIGVYRMMYRKDGTTWRITYWHATPTAP